MSRHAQVRINDVFLTVDGTAAGRGARCFIEDGNKFSSGLVASTAIALDGSVHAQVRAQQGRGVSFGVRADYLNVAVAELLRDAVMVAFAEGAPVRVRASDVFVNFDVLAIPDFTQGGWINYEGYSGGILKNVKMRFVSTGEAS